MDERRFDDLTKLVGRRSSRRAVIKAAVAGVIVSIFGSPSARAGLSPVGTRPNLCIQAGQSCNTPGVDPSRDCCYKCNNQTHTCCEAIGYECQTDADCCVKVVDGENVQPICRDPNTKDTDRHRGCFLPGALDPGAECLKDSDCSSGFCLNGVCQPCTSGQTPCGAGCCNAANCQTCVNGACKSTCGPCQTCDGAGGCVDTCTACQYCNSTTGQCAPNCNDALCQTCDPDTGACVTCGGDRCQVCRNGACVDACNLCQTCDPNTGACTPNTCPTCQECDPASGQCAPKTCPPGQTCDPTSGVCGGGCGPCESLQSGACVSDCTNCQVCGATGCVDKCTDPCAPCDADGHCTPIDCGPCQICDPFTGICVDACPGQECDPTTGACTPLECSPCEVQLEGVCVLNCGQCEVCVPTIGCVAKCLGPCDRCDENGQCVSIECPDCQTCDAESRTCTGGCDADQCLECVDEQCVDQCLPCQKCIAGFCVDTCLLDCGTCDPDTGQCVSNCTDCQICHLGSCVDTCTNACAPCDPATGECTEADCDPCQTCDPTTGACVEKCPGEDCDSITGICTPATCGPCETLLRTPARSCVNACTNCQICGPTGCIGKCILACAPCDADGHCTPIDCGLCQVCDGGSCVDKCPLDQTCDPTSGDCSGGCGPCESLQSGACVSDCTNCQICDGGTCVDTCTDLCAPCDPATGECTEVDCDPCHTCDPTTGACVEKCPDEDCDPATGICTTPTCGPCETLQGGVCVDACTNCQICAPTGCVDKCPNPCVFCDANGQCIPIECPDCQSCDGGICVNDCLACETCTAGFCVDDCRDCQICAPDTQTCTGSCPADQCLECVDNHCVTTCGACKTCSAGACVGLCDPTSGCLCAGSPVIFAGRTGCAGSDLTIDWSSENTHILGATHSNGGMTIHHNPTRSSTGSGNVFAGPVTYVCNGVFEGNNNHFLGGVSKVDPRLFPVSFTVNDFTCTYGSLTTGGDFDLSPDGPWWVDGSRHSGQLNPGTYCAQGKLRLDENNISGTVTFIGMADVEMTGNGCILQAYEHGVLFFSPAASPDLNSPVVRVEGNDGDFTGLLYAPNGEVDYAGNNSVLSGSIVGWTVEVSSNNITIGRRACTSGGVCPPTG